MSIIAQIKTQSELNQVVSAIHSLGLVPHICSEGLTLGRDVLILHKLGEYVCCESLAYLLENNWNSSGSVNAMIGEAYKNVRQ